MATPQTLQFQGSAESKRFDPITPASSTKAAVEDASRLSQSWQEAAQFNLTQEKRSIAFRDAQNQETFAGLAKFSDTLTKHLVKEQEKRNEEEMQRGLMKAYEEGIPMDQHLEYEANKQQLADTNNQVQQTAFSWSKAGAPPEAVDQLKGMSAWEKWGYAKGKAMQAGELYPLWLQERFKDTTSRITMPDGAVVTPAEALGNPMYQAALTAQLRQEYFQSSGLVGMNPALLNEHTFPGMRKVEHTLLSRARTEFNVNKSAMQLEQYNDDLADGSISLSQWFTSTASTLDKEGNVRGFSGAWQAFEQLSDEASDAGMPLDLDALGRQIDPETGKTFKERFKRKWALLEENQQKHLRGNYADYQATQDMEYTQAEEAAIAEIGNASESWTNAEIEAVQKGLVQKYGRRSQKLDELKNYTLEAEQKQQIEQQLKYKAEHGMLQPEDLVGLPLDLQTKYGQLAQDQGAGSAVVKPYLDSVEELVKGAVNWSPDKALGGTAAIAIGELQALFRQKYATYLRQSIGPQEAAVRAAAEVKEYFQQSQDPSKFPNSKFYLGGDGKGQPGTADGKPLKPDEFFPNLLPKALATGVKTKFTHFNNELKQVQAEGKPADSVLDVPGAVLNRQDIQSIGDGKSGNIQVPQYVQYLANKLNISPWEIINRQRKAAGFPELDKTPSIEAAEKLSPRALRLINQFPSPNRAARAWATSGTFNEAIVPMGLGKEITRAAKANGVDPALVAAVIDFENRGQWSNKTSPSGAKGIAQFMPDTAREFGVNVNDPVSSVQGAAKYLKYLIDYFQGDTRLAVLAYNGGMGNIKRYGGPIPGNKENQEYHQGVMRAYAKYSGGPALQATLRGRFQGTNNVVATGQVDQGNRPIRFSPNAASAWQRMVSAGMPVNSGDVASTHRTEQDYNRIKSQGNNPAPNSRHNYGEAIDAHGATGAWIRKHGSKYGWYPNDYDGSHGGHYEYRG
jgi:hypothetical protein